MWQAQKPVGNKISRLRQLTHRRARVRAYGRAVDWVRNKFRTPKKVHPQPQAATDAAGPGWGYEGVPGEILFKCPLCLC